MRRLILLSLLFVLPAGVAAAETIKLGTKTPAVGEKWSEEKSSSVNMTITVKGQPPLAMTIEETEKKKTEVLAVKDDIVTKAKMTYETKTKTEKAGGQSKGGKSPIEGKTYTLTAGDPVTVEPSGEADAVRKEEKRFGKPDKMRKAIAGKEYTKGKVVELKPEDGADVFGDKEFEITKLTLEYTGMDGKNPKFALRVSMKGKGKPLTMDLKGTVVVDQATAEPLTMDMTGTVKADDKDMKIDGTLTMKGKRSK
jgi:hypothetical protein